MQYNIYRYLPVSMKNSIVLLPCIFEPTEHVTDMSSDLQYCKSPMHSAYKIRLMNIHQICV